MTTAPQRLIGTHHHNADAVEGLEHDLLDGTIDQDTEVASVVTGDLIFGNLVPLWDRLPFTTAPSAGLRNALVGDSGDAVPAWRATLDTTAPTDITPGDVADSGSALIYARRDHLHGAGDTYPAEAHNLLSLTHPDTTPASPTRGDTITAQGGSTKWTVLAIGAANSFYSSDGTDVSWHAAGALTKTDDTNVTLTLGGTPATALLRAASLTLGWTGQLAIGRGGTGVSALGDITRVNDTNVTLTLGGTPLGALITSTSFTLGWTGLLSLARGGTHADLSATGGAGNYLKQSSVGADVTVGTIPASDIASGAALTKTDDTNVTLTLGGTPASALLKAASLTLGWTGLLGLARGGTHTDLSATGGTKQYLKQASAGADITVGTIPASDIASGAALTRTNDTNVTLTLGGTPASALLVAASLTLGWTGLLGLARGGTHADLSATGGAGQYLKQVTLGADVTVGTIPASDIASGAALTKVDDTNVTLALGGTPASALLAAASLTLGWTGTLSVARGGTGAATLTSQGVLVGNGASIISPTVVNASATRKFLMQVSGNFPLFDTLGIADLPNNGANPSGLIGMAAVNGSATTWLRSDSTHAIDPAIAPTWTGVHTFSGTSAPQIIIAPATGNAILRLAGASGSISEISFRAGATSKWQLLRNTDDSFGLNDLATPTTNALRIVAGAVPGVSTVGYLRIGSAAAPSNVTAGDITGLRGHFGTDGAFTTFNAITAGFEVVGAALFHTGTVTNNTSAGAGTAAAGLYQGLTMAGSADFAAGTFINPTMAPSANVVVSRGFSAWPIISPPVGVTIGNAESNHYRMTYGAAAGAVTNGYTAVVDSPLYNGTLVPTSQYGLYIVNQNASAKALTNVIGLHIEAQTSGTNNYDMSMGTVDLTAAGTYYGRIPVLYNGLKKYVHVFNA